MRQLLFVSLLAFCLLPLAAFAAENTIKMGVSLPLTGEVASYGDDLKAGIELAVSDINAKGGVLGKKLQPLFEDDGADPKSSVAVANRFLGEKIDVAINGVSRTSMPIAPIYAEENIPFFNLASTDAITTHGWDNLVRTIPKNGQEAPKLATLIAQKAAGHKLAMLYSSEEYSSNLTETTIQILAQSKITADIVMKMSDKDQDFSSIIGRLKDQKIDTAFLGFWPKAAGGFLRQAAAADYRPVFIGDGVASMDDLVKIAGPQANGLAFTMYPDPQQSVAAQPVLKALAARHIVNRPFAVYAYLLVQVYAEAAEKAGTTASDKLLRTLKTEKFNTIMGPVTFTADGDMQGIDFEYYQWQNGKIIPLK
jgi:branched-chain amino acid transport system substrate-binding protein